MANNADKGRVPPEYKLFREEIRFEHSQINSRMSWYLASQTIFAGAFALLAADSRLRIVLCLIPVVGVFMSVFALLGVHAAATKINWLRLKGESRHLDRPYYAGSMKASQQMRPRWLNLCDKLNRFGFAFPYGVPLVLLLFWICLLVFCVWLPL